MYDELANLANFYARLKSTGRGKHIGPLSYYHESLIGTVPRLSDDLAILRRRLRLQDAIFNVVKLDSRQCISFLRYEPFEIAFPALLAAESCNLRRRTIRLINFVNRPNPPILHRKELLLPAWHPLVPEATNLTRRLERLGAFRHTNTIGTRRGWQRRLADLRIDESGCPLK